MAELSWLTFVVLVAASFRLTRLATTDLITEPLRRRIWARWPSDDTLYPDDGTVAQDRDDPAFGTTAHGIEVFYDDSDREYPGWRPVRPTMVGYLVGCDDCASVWCSLVLVVPVGLVLGLAWWTVLVWLGVAGGVAVVVRYA